MGRIEADNDPLGLGARVHVLDAAKSSKRVADPLLAAGAVDVVRPNNCEIYLLCHASKPPLLSSASNAGARARGLYMALYTFQRLESQGADTHKIRTARHQADCEACQKRKRSRVATVGSSRLADVLWGSFVSLELRVTDKVRPVAPEAQLRLKSVAQ